MTGTDLPVWRASKVGFKIEMEKLPLTRGAKIKTQFPKANYELLFAISPRDRSRLQQRWAKKFPNLPLVRIGSLNRQSKIENRKLPVATFISNSPAETEAMGQQFAEEIGIGSILALRGDLGSGKTVFVKGLVDGLGSRADVTSPTFTILHEYRGGRLPVYHFDFFRLEERESIVRLGLDVTFSAMASVIEWAERFPELIPQRALILFEIKSDNQQAITVEGRPGFQSALYLRRTRDRRP
jgi:tRNA threonylcarbamoyladenosine biosynthesis protein TsaE